MRWNMLIFMDGRLRGSGVFHNGPRAGSQHVGGRRPISGKAGLKVVDVLNELDASHRAFLRAASDVPEALFAPGGAARDLFEGVGPGHYREHAAQIREWRQKESA